MCQLVVIVSQGARWARVRGGSGCEVGQGARWARVRGGSGSEVGQGARWARVSPTGSSSEVHYVFFSV